MELASLTPRPLLNALTETRIDVESIAPAPSVVHIQLPSTSTFARQTRAVIKIVGSNHVCKDEAEFQRRNVASASSIFFRAGLEDNEEKYPRAVAWRVVEQSTVLELRSLDLMRSERQHNKTNQVLRFSFPSPIRTSGVALADAAKDKAVSVFVMTKNNELYTITIRPALFARPSPTPDDIHKSFAVFRPSALSISTFYKLSASSSLVVLLSLGDGRLSRLSRKLGEDGTQWNETVCDDGQWTASFRGLLPWHAKPTVQYEGITLNVKTLHTALLTPDEHHVITTGIDHTLKVWSLETGKPTIVRDLLNQPLGEEGHSKVTLDPAAPATLRLFESRIASGYKCYAVTFSTQRGGVFKFWGILDPDDPDNGISDCVEGHELRLPDPADGALWTLADFDVHGNPDTSQLDVWVLMRLNRRFQLFHRKFLDMRELEEEWDSDWTGTAVENRKHEPAFAAPQLQNTQLDPHSMWLDFLFTPNRIPSKVIETALAVYAHTKNSNIPMPRGSLPERVAMLISTHTKSSSSDVRGKTLLKTATAIEREWQNFWNIVQDVDGLRWEPLSLAIDAADAIPWIAFADGFSVARDCSELETIAYNTSESLEQYSASQPLPSVEGGLPAATDLSEQVTLVNAARAFRLSFTHSLRDQCQQAFADELWSEPMQSPSDRIQSLYDACNFADDISTRQYYDLRGSLENIGGFGGLKSYHFTTVAARVPSSPRRDPKTVFTKIGLRALVCAVQDMVALQLRVLQDLLYVVVFVYGEADASEELSDDLDLESVFVSLIEQLKRAELAYWLASKARLGSERSGDDYSQPGVAYRVTVLEDLFARDIKPQTEEGRLERSGLTRAIQDLVVWVAGGNEISLDNALVSIQCDLLRNGDLELCSSFEAFLPSTAWATYVRGRLCLLRQQYIDAALCFKRSAFRLSRPDPPSSTYALSSSGLLDEAAASHFASGLAPFYLHIVALFEAAAAAAHALTFARLALLHGPTDRDAALGHLFRAALTLGDFDTATSALNRLSDPAAQQVALRALLARLLEAGALDTLLDLPLPHLESQVDELLAERARASPNVGPNGVPFFKLLYAWRLRRGDMRGAAAVLIERLVATPTRLRGEAMLDEYLVGLNALALVGGGGGGGGGNAATKGVEEADDVDDAWVFVQREGKPRQVVRLQDLRAAYGEALDRLGMLEMGRFGIVAEEDEDDEMDDA